MCRLFSVGGVPAFDGAQRRCHAAPCVMIAGHKHAVLLSFEGPDRYSSIGGLGTRESAFARALGEAEIETQLFFVGDPKLPAIEAYAPGVTLRRWCQWISAYHPHNVYDGEDGKVEDFTYSVP